MLDVGRWRPDRSASDPIPAASEFLAPFLCAGLALALLAAGCAGPRPLKGGKATTTRNQAGLIQQLGLASLVYPPLKVIVASVTTGVALMLGGVALTVLPTMVVGNELLILGGVALVVGAWFLAHRHGQLSGLVAATTGGAPASASAGSPPSTGATSAPAALRESPMANGK